MKASKTFVVIALGSLALFSCKSDIDSKTVEATGTEQVKTAETQEQVVRTIPLSKTQRDNANSLTNKLMRTTDAQQFTRALVSAGMIQDFSNLESEFTILAPNNGAFNGLPEGQNIVSDPSRVDELKALLSMHIIEGTVTSAQLSQEIQQNSTYELTSISGEKLMASMKGDAIIITNVATDTGVVLGKTDIKGTNGVLHLVDGFLK